MGDAQPVSRPAVGVVPGAVAVVTDSTAYLPTGTGASVGVTVVPLHVMLGGVPGAEGVDVTPADVARALADWLPVTTSRPSPAEFVRAYRALLDAGAAAVVSIHLSRDLSGTWEAARLAAEECGGALRVRVVDSRSTAMGLGFPVLAAARVARAGADLQRVYEVAVATAARTTTLFSVETLEFLRRGGRIGAARALLGTALSVKPILHVADGRIVPLEKVRTAAKSLARLEALAATVAGTGRVDIAVHHLDAADRAGVLAERLRERLPQVRDLHVCQIGAAVGAHVGPGVLGAVISRV